MSSIQQNIRLWRFGLASVAFGVLAGSATAQSLWSYSLVGGTNHLYGGYIGVMDDQSVNDNSVAQASVDRSFTGLDGNGNTQTMNFQGSTVSQSDYGNLHVYTTGTVTNTYYNEANPFFYNSDTGEYNQAGSPDGLVSLGFAGFNDQLQFGGALQAGYTAKYVFHAQGTNSGDGALADLGVTIGNNPGEAFFAVGDGSFNEDWVTQSYQIDGNTPQSIAVQFSDQFAINTYDYADGSNVSGTSNFKDTVTLAGIEVLDANGNLASGWTVDSASGTKYPTIQGTPEPASTAAVAVGIVGLLGRRRRKA